MTTTQPNPLVLYHDNCADGFGAAFAAWLKLGNQAEYRGLRYSTQMPTLEDYAGRDVYLLDFSLPRADTETLLKEAARVVWLDHHESAFEMWCGKKQEYFADRAGRHHITLDNNKSGAYLAWEYFHPGYDIPMLIRHIDDYDRWQFAIEGTRAFIKALWSHRPWRFEHWQHLRHLGPASNGLDTKQRQQAENYRAMFAEGEAILRTETQNIKQVIASATRPCRIPAAPNAPDAICDANGVWAYHGHAVNAPYYMASEIGNAIAVDKGTFALIWSVGDSGECQCSLRSIGDTNVNHIAQTLGGGGHKNASGFRVPLSALANWII